MLGVCVYGCPLADTGLRVVLPRSSATRAAMGSCFGGLYDARRRDAIDQMLPPHEAEPMPVFRRETYTASLELSWFAREV